MITRSYFLILLTPSPISASAADIVGRASVIDGDTLEIASTRIRLAGIEAPEASQLCRGQDSLHYRCGAKAANDLDAMLKDRVVTCSTSGRSYDRVVATCTVDDTDISAWMVKQGLALDWPKYSKGRYAADQQAAERGERGM